MNSCIWTTRADYSLVNSACFRIVKCSYENKYVIHILIESQKTHWHSSEWNRKQKNYIMGSKGTLIGGLTFLHKNDNYECTCFLYCLSSTPFYQTYPVYSQYFSLHAAVFCAGNSRRFQSNLFSLSFYPSDGLSPEPENVSIPMLSDGAI